MAGSDTAEDAKMAEELQAVKPMKIKEIKAELDERGVNYQDLLEKNEFMQRLAEARVKGITKPPPSEEPAQEEAAEAPKAQQQQQASSPPPPPPKQEEAAPKPAVDEAARYAQALEEVMKLRVSEIKKELDLLKVPHTGFFEKKEFAEALAKARLNPSTSTSRADNVDPDEDPSQYRFVEVKRMPKAGAEDGGAGGPGGPRGGGPGAGRGGPRPGPGPAGGSPFGGGGSPFGDMFNQAQGGAGAGPKGASGPGGFGDIFGKGGRRGGATGAASAGGGFGSMFDAFTNMGGAGGGMPGMGGFDPSMLSSLMSNPKAMAAMQRAQSNPRIMAAFQDVMANPANLTKYANDPEISSVLNDLQSAMRK